LYISIVYNILVISNRQLCDNILLIKEGVYG